MRELLTMLTVGLTLIVIVAIATAFVAATMDRR